jgi:hypothetical protein
LQRPLASRAWVRRYFVNMQLARASIAKHAMCTMSYFLVIFKLLIFKGFIFYSGWHSFCNIPVTCCQE